ncbi:L-carnitine dehydratase/bile acid-inducible protein F [Desulfitobacterium hafniense DCB-2]|uniref:L-carnitine dehydratase/bile acid-inducible protein F n=1 Tax=Desulfitobacterium hafniense (strain DSM 10664 / DCB-2) TaxID=272564 RepID=B8FXJ7_DESHD|nr:CoA transferase [Desulfitobacterium hafniense]ACL22598.1 L-carnitine dehydratase/bile acid-inducible protein F [Desulfitobacterium hafniense DCB-2]
MVKRVDAPQRGALQGVRVVHASMSIAGPFAAALMADMGADVIWVESAKAMDITRYGPGMASQLDRRNQRTIALNIPTPAGKEIFLRLIRETDIFIEASRGGQYRKWGLTDEVLWEVNPRLVIVHISGFGQTGDNSYTGRASYDPIAQAFGGLMSMNGLPGTRPAPAEVSIADYYTGFLAAYSALAAYIRAQSTGEGDSIDVAQYEAILRCQSGWPLDSWNHTERVYRRGMGNNNNAGFNSYRCGDGKEVYIVLLGVGVVKAALPIFGFTYGTDEFPASGSYKLDTRGGQKLEAAIEDFCRQRTAREVEEILRSAGVPCSMLMNHEMMPDHPHFLARETITRWQTVDGQSITGQNIVPKLKNNPGHIWRGCPTIGMDTEDILAEAGFSAREIASFYEKNIIKKGV